MKNKNLNVGDNWATPEEFYQELNQKYKFDFDPCPLNASFDGLNLEWGQMNFVNPPYSRKLKEAFVEKAVVEKTKGKKSVLLLPVSTSTRLFHDVILKNIEKHQIEFIRGRIKFKGVNTYNQYVTNNTGMHDSMLIYMGFNS